MELHLAARRIDEHAETFLTVYKKAQWQAEDTVLGSGLASVALSEMSTAWERDGIRFAQHLIHYAEGHRGASNAYIHNDDEGAQTLTDLGRGL